LHHIFNWLQMPHVGAAGEWRAVAMLCDGTAVERTATVK
jgi:hypothetical protein